MNGTLVLVAGLWAVRLEMFGHVGVFPLVVGPSLCKAPRVPVFSEGLPVTFWGMKAERVGCGAYYVGDVSPERVPMVCCEACDGRAVRQAAQLAKLSVFA